ALNLRRIEKYSFAELQRITGIPATTIRNWCLDINSGNRWDTLLIKNERNRQALKIFDVPDLKILDITNAVYAKLFIALIYWCEGSKYPATNKINFTNSDISLMKVFVTLFRKAFFLDESKFRVHLQIHNTHNYDEIKQLWSDALNISPSQFLKPTITKAKGGKHRINYLGTCTVRYYDYKILLRITGIYEELIRKLGEVA